MIFVDNMQTPASVRNGTRVIVGLWSHLTSDDLTDEELHAFARKLGLRRTYHQPSPPASRSHYDLTEPKRQLAIRLGAVAVRIGCEPWRGLGQRRTRDSYAAGGSAYAADAVTLVPAEYVFPEPTARQRVIDRLEAS